jgi:hypothetical protein
MSVEVFKDGVSYLVEPNDLQGYLNTGYFLELEPYKIDEEARPNELANAADAYEEKFGQKPHHKMKLETIMEKLNGD